MSSTAMKRTLSFLSAAWSGRRSAERRARRTGSFIWGRMKLKTGEFVALAVAEILFHPKDILEPNLESIRRLRCFSIGVRVGREEIEVGVGPEAGDLLAR